VSSSIFFQAKSNKVCRQEVHIFRVSSFPRSTLFSTKENFYLLRRKIHEKKRIGFIFCCFECFCVVKLFLLLFIYSQNFNELYCKIFFQNSPRGFEILKFLPRLFVFLAKYRVIYFVFFLSFLPNNLSRCLSPRKNSDFAPAQNFGNFFAPYKLVAKLVFAYLQHHTHYQFPVYLFPPWSIDAF